MRTKKWLGLFTGILSVGCVSNKLDKTNANQNNHLLQQAAVSGAHRTTPFKVIGTTLNVSNLMWHNGEWDGPGYGSPWKEAVKQQLSLGVKPLRFSTEWDKIEKAPGKYNFANQDYILNTCAARSVPVTPAVGIKSLFWPEYYIPEQYDPHSEKSDEEKQRIKRTIGLESKDPLFAYLNAFLDRYANDPRIHAFQVENEPFEGTGYPETKISPLLLKQEMELFRSKTAKPLMLTMGAGLTDNLATQRAIRPRILRDLIALKPDVIGFNLYQKGYGDNDWRFDATDAQWEFAKQLVAMVKAAGIKPVITEIQLIPWESNPSNMDFVNPLGNKSFKPQDCRVIYERAAKLGCDEIYLWGLEFQLACKNAGNSEWLNTTRELFSLK